MLRLRNAHSNKSGICFHKSWTCFSYSPSCADKSRTCEVLHHALSGWAAEANQSRCESRSLSGRYSFRAHVYIRYFTPEKTFTLSHRASFPLIFSSFCVKDWISKHSHGRWTLVKGGTSKPSHLTTVDIQEINHINGHHGVNAWFFKPSHQNHWESDRNCLHVKGWILFGGIKSV